LSKEIRLTSLFRSLFVLAVLPGVLGGQATQTVPPDDPVYAFIDRLVAARLVDTVLVGQRSMSRREVGRIIASAQARSAEHPWLEDRIRNYATIFPDTLGRGPMTVATAGTLTVMESPTRGIEPDANGAILARVNPLSANQLGRPITDGITASYRAGISLGVTPWLTFAAQEQASWLDARGAEGERTRSLELLYARALWKNAALTVGRDYLFFGQGNTAGLTSSLNPRAIDQVRLASDKPFVFPWLFRYVGPTHATIMLGDLGGNQFFPHTRFFAYKVSTRPRRRFEIGAALTEQVGGEGAPGGTFLQKAGDAFPLLDALFLHRNFLFSNKFVAVDIRYTIPRARGLQFYAEGAFDDFDLRRVRSVFTEDAGYVWGLSASCFHECGPVRASVEYHVTGLRYYTHGGFRGGYTVDNLIIGDQLGPRGRGGYTTLDVDRGSHSWSVSLAHEIRNGDRYGATATAPDDTDFRFVKLEQHPAERRWRIMPAVKLGGVMNSWTVDIGGGAERVENFDHTADTWRTNWMTQFSVHYRSRPR
jgi:hypothetical protein